MKEKSSHPIAEALFRRGLGFYPAEFRREYGPQMVDFFQQAYREELSRGAGLHLAHFWLRTCTDIVCIALKQHAEILGQDLTHAARMLRKSLAFTLVAVFTLAIGIGANTAVFSFVNGLLLRPLPYAEPEQLVTVWESPSTHGNERNRVSYPNFRDWDEQNRAFAYLSAFAYFNLELNIDGARDSARGVLVSGEFFKVLGVSPSMGRAFIQREQEINQRVAIISYDLWQRRFGGDLGVIGSTVGIDGGAWTIVGIMPQEFRYPDSGIDLWLPIAGALPSELRPRLSARSERSWNVIGRLRAEVSLPQAQAQMDTLARRLQNQYADTNAGWGARLVGLHEQTVGDTRPGLLMLFAMVSLVLLIACTNLANLFLVRSAARHPEITIRMALGALPGRVIRQLLTEAVLLASLGGALGLLIAFVGVKQLIVFLELTRMPRIEEVGVDGRVLAFAAVTSLLSGIAFGLFPALQLSKLDLNGSLKAGGRGNASIHGRRLRSGLAVAQVALSLVLLVSTSLVVRSFLNLQRTDPGFDPQSVLVAALSVDDSRYTTPRRRVAYFERAIERIAATPEVRAVGLVSVVPLSGFYLGGDRVLVEGQPLTAAGEMPLASVTVVSTRYFEAMNIPLLKGRTFSTRDNLDAPRVAIVGSRFARRLFGGLEPVGKRIAVGSSPSARDWVQIVGVVEDVRAESLQLEPGLQIYLPHAQMGSGSMSLVVRTVSKPADFAPTLRRAVQAIDPSQSTLRTRTLTNIVSKSMVEPRLRATLLAAFGAVALCLAALGLYGVVSYSVDQRTHEIGVRMALGARPGTILLMVLRQGMALALLGVGLGLVGAFATSRLLSSLLFGISSSDPATFAAVALLLCGVTLIACYVPARKATSISPMTALRYE